MIRNISDIDPKVEEKDYILISSRKGKTSRYEYRCEPHTSTKSSTTSENVKPNDEVKTRNEHLFVVLAGLLAREQLRCNVGDDTTLRDNDIAEELVQFLIVADRKLEVAGHDTRER